jgi:hypothetical protein
MDGPAIRRAIEEGLLPKDVPQRLSDCHPYWEMVRLEAQREAAVAKRLADRGAPSGAPSRPTMTKAEFRFVESNRTALAACTIPTATEVRGAAGLLREAAAALRTALETLRRVKEARWPIASDQIDDHLADRIDDLLSEDRVGLRWAVTDLTEVADDLSGPDRSTWIKLIEAGHLKPRAAGASPTPLAAT